MIKQTRTLLLILSWLMLGTSQLQAASIVDTRSFNRHTYHLVAGDKSDIGITWTDAEDFAQTLEGHLATVNNQAENDFLLNTWGSIRLDGGLRVGQLWIGLNDRAEEGRFEWTSGAPVKYTNWGAGEPNNREDEDYIHITTRVWQPFPPSNPVCCQPGTWNDNQSTPIERNNPTWLSYGIVEVPEPATFLGSFLLLGLLYFHRRHYRGPIHDESR